MPPSASTAPGASASNSCVPPGTGARVSVTSSPCTALASAYRELPATLAPDSRTETCDKAEEPLATSSAISASIDAAIGAMPILRVASLAAAAMASAKGRA